MSPNEAVRRWIEECHQELAWEPGTREQVRQWQDELRQRLREAIGIQRFVIPAVEWEAGEGHPGDGFLRSEIRFESRSGCVVTGYLLLPLDIDEPRPGILCLPGHGVGVDAVVGLKDEPYHADFALQSVRRGYPTLALEQFGFGNRRTNEEWSSCHADSTTALMLGETMTGWRVWDAMRGLDVLASHPSVDPARLVTMGISGGGLTSLWTAALDERVHTAVVSGYFNTFRDSVLSVHHCVDNFVPGVLRLCEMPDFAGLVAPRRLFVEGGTRDDLFPIEPFRKAVGRAREIYEAFGAPDRFDSEEFDGEHRFHGVGAFAFLARG
jgi:hypothetical protein